MSIRIPALLTTGLCLVAIGGTAGTASARQGADDPAGHVRQSRGADDPAGHVRHSGGADDGTRASTQRRASRHRHRSGHRHRHGGTRRADDRGGRRGGHDDGPNHT